MVACLLEKKREEGREGGREREREGGEGWEPLAM